MSRSTRLIAMQLALAAMLLRALIPLGWMPATTLAGGTWLEICTGMATPAETGQMDMPGMAGMPDMPGMMHHHGHHHDPASIHDICPFAAAVHFATPGGEAQLRGPTRLAWRLVRDESRAQTRPAVLLDTAAPRGPPPAV